MAYNPNFVGSVGKGSSRQNQTTYQNGTMSTMPVATAVSTITNGNVVLTNVASVANAEAWVGLTAQYTPSAAQGLVVSDGRLENIPLSLGFTVGDAIWVGTTPGSLTNVKPDLLAMGWSAGYFVLFVGVVVKNQFNGSEQDIQLCRQIIGQL